MECGYGKGPARPETEEWRRTDRERSAEHCYQDARGRTHHHSHHGRDPQDDLPRLLGEPSFHLGTQLRDLGMHFGTQLRNLGTQYRTQPRYLGTQFGTQTPLPLPRACSR